MPATLGGIISGTTVGTIYLGPYSYTPNAAGNHQCDEYNLGAVSVTQPIPNWATMCIIIPPAANTVAITLKGNNTDVGIPISPNLPTFIPLNLGTAGSIVIIAAGSTVGGVTSIMFA